MQGKSFNHYAISPAHHRILFFIKLFKFPNDWLVDDHIQICPLKTDAGDLYEVEMREAADVKREPATFSFHFWSP